MDSKVWRNTVLKIIIIIIFFFTRFCMVAGKRMVDDARREIFVNSELAYYFYHQSEDPCRPRQFLEL